MEETKAAIRLRIRAGREERHRTGGEASRRVQRRALLSAWWAVLARLPGAGPRLPVPPPGTLRAHRPGTRCLGDPPGAPAQPPARPRRRGRPRTGGARLGTSYPGLRPVRPLPAPARTAGGTTPGSTGIGEADVILVAALAVDEGGSRLGQGGGWDRPGLPVRGPVSPWSPPCSRTRCSPPARFRASPTTTASTPPSPRQVPGCWPELVSPRSGSPPCPLHRVGP